MTSTTSAIVFDNLVPADHPPENFPTGRTLPSSNLLWLWLMTRLQMILFIQNCVFPVCKLFDYPRMYIYIYKQPVFFSTVNWMF